MANNIPFEPSKVQVKRAPYSYSQFVRVDDSMISLQANNLAQDLLGFHRVIAGCGSVAPQDKGEPTAVSFLYLNQAMGNEAAPKAIEENVSALERGWHHRLNRDQVAITNGGMHACPGGSKTHSETKAQQLST